MEIGALVAARVAAPPTWCHHPFSGGFAGLRQSTIGRPSGQDGTPLLVRVQDRRQVSGAIVSSLLARSRSSMSATAAWQAPPQPGLFAPRQLNSVSSGPWAVLVPSPGGLHGTAGNGTDAPAPNGGRPLPLDRGRSWRDAGTRTVGRLARPTAMSPQRTVFPDLDPFRADGTDPVRGGCGAAADHTRTDDSYSYPSVYPAIATTVRRAA